MLKLHGLLVPVHGVGEPVHVARLQPAKTEVPFGAADSVPVALLSRATEHVVVHGLGDGAGDAGETLPNVTEPPPAPAKVIDMFLLAMTYGPTKGPPEPFGAAPAG